MGSRDCRLHSLAVLSFGRRTFGEFRKVGTTNKPFTQTASWSLVPRILLLFPACSTACAPAIVQTPLAVGNQSATHLSAWLKLPPARSFSWPEASPGLKYSWLEATATLKLLRDKSSAAPAPADSARCGCLRPPSASCARGVLSPCFHSPVATRRSHDCSARSPARPESRPRAA